jgi:hypothetical protein
MGKNLKTRGKNKMNRNAKKIEEALERLIHMEEFSSLAYEPSDGEAQWIDKITSTIRDILCDHNEKEYQAEETENNVPESLHCINCNKEFNVQDEQEAQLENERD